MRWFPLTWLIGAALAVAQNTSSTAAAPDTEKKKTRLAAGFLNSSVTANNSNPTVTEIPP